jgi:hypothetical protein
LTGSVLVLALAAAVNPSMLAVVLVLLSLSRPRALIAAYLLGGLLISVGIGIAVLAGANGSGAVRHHSQLSPAIDVGAGAVVLLVAFVLATGRRPHRRGDRRHAEGKSRASAFADRLERLLTRGTTPIAFLAGAVMNLPGLYYVVALKDMSAARLSTADDLVWVLAFNLIMFLPAIATLALLWTRPDETAAQIRRFEVWLRGRGGRHVLAGLAAAVGAYLVVRGVARLAS